MGKNHKASCGIMSTNPFTGEKTNKRIGTRFANTNVEVWKMMGNPWFKFRNDEERKKWFEWQEKTSAEIDIGELHDATNAAFTTKGQATKAKP